jgi:hypothetical protein
VSSRIKQPVETVGFSLLNCIKSLTSAAMRRVVGFIGGILEYSDIAFQAMQL